MRALQREEDAAYAFNDRLDAVGQANADATCRRARRGR